MNAYAPGGFDDGRRPLRACGAEIAPFVRFGDYSVLGLLGMAACFASSSDSLWAFMECSCACLLSSWAVR